jgi:serine/threonine-protein kinase
MNDDQNLLFGVLALELDLVTHAQFAEACAVWAARKDVPLAEVLVNRGWLDSEGRADVEKLLARKLRKHNGDVHQSLAEAADPSVRHAMLNVEDDSIRKTISFLPPSRSVGFVEVETLDHRPETRSHFTLTRIHGKGGLGRVWLARDSHLKRRVALKEILPGREVDPAWERRLVREAQVTGQLEHPNIVPVYELSEEAQDEKLFYVMRYVEGQTLWNAICRYHEQRRAGKPEPMEFRRLVEAFVDVCHAVDYAHSRGVIHRDLKPSNVMLGAFGEVTVLDWGLAKVVGKPATQDDSPPITLSPVDDEHLTQYGQALGTPPYMAPEQADPTRSSVDRRTDIYGLGAILFAILTSAAPHRKLLDAIQTDDPRRKTKTQEMFQQIAQAPTPRARDRTSSAPPVLDAICAKAMARKQSDRYQSAQELAEDVKRWLADEPVSVYREPWSHRLSRWMRRHRAWTQSIAASLLIVTVTAIGAFFLVDRARRAEKTAKIQAEQAFAAEKEAKIQAEEAFAEEQAARAAELRRFREACRTVDTMATGVSQALQYYPGTLALRARLLEGAAEAYEGLTEEGSQETDILIESGRALVRLGDVYRALGQYDQAADAFRQALNRFDVLSQSVDDREDLAFESCECLLRLAQLQTELSRTPEDHERTEQTLNEAENRLEPLDPSARKLHASARLRVTRAEAKRGMNETEDAIKLLEGAERQWEELTESEPDGRTEHQENLARACSIRANILLGRGQHEEAMVAIDKSVDIYAQLVEQDKDHPRYLEGLTNSRLERANALRGLGRRQEHEMVLKAAVGDSEALFRSNPLFPRFMDISAVSRAVLGRVYHQQARNKEAHKQLDLAVARLKWLVDYVSPLEKYRANLAVVLALRGQILRDLGEPSAEDDLEEARRHYEQLIAAQPKYSADWRGLGMCKRHLARLFHGTGRHGEARSLYDEAQKDFEEALRLNPQDPFTRDGLASCLEHRGDLPVEPGQDPQKDLERATTIRRELCATRDTPEDTYKLALLLLKLGDEEKDEALTLATDLANSVPDNTKYQTLLGAAHYQTGDFEASVQTLDRPQPQQGDGSHQFWLAKALWNRNQDDDRDRAKKAFQRGVQLMEAETPGQIEVQKLRRDAADLLGLPMGYRESDRPVGTGPTGLPEK